MPWRWTNMDARPMSEYLYNHYLARKKHIFLFYCRECIKNYESIERIDKCPKCAHALLELPKEPKFSQRKHAKPYNPKDFKKSVVKSKKELLQIIEPLKLMLWRMKIAVYYFMLPDLEELR